MALQRALEEILEGIRAEIVALRRIKNQIKADLAQEKGEHVMGTGESIGDWFFDTFTTAVDETVIERAQILADIVSYEIWGGARGWERATGAQFEVLVNKLKEKLRGSTDERITPVQRDERVSGECHSTNPGGSEPVDYHPLAEAVRDPEPVRRRRRTDI